MLFDKGFTTLVIYREKTSLIDDQIFIKKENSQYEVSQRSSRMYMKIPCKKPSFTTEELEELKRIHQKHTGEVLSNAEAIEMGTRLVTLFKIIAKPLRY